MATPPALTQIAFAAPLDESTEDEILDPQIGFAVSVNTRQDQRGGVSKRLGFRPRTTIRTDGTDRMSGRRLLSHQGTPCVIDGATLDSYMEEADLWTSPGRVPECMYRLRDLPTPSGSAVCVDMAVANGYIAVAYNLTPLGIPAVALVGSDSGAVLREPEVLDDASARISLASYGTRIFAFVAVDGELRISYLRTDAFDGGWNPLSPIPTATWNRPSVCSLADRVAVVYATDDPTNRITVATLDDSGVLTSTTIDTEGKLPGHVDIDGQSGSLLWVVWDQNDTVEEPPPLLLSAHAVALNASDLSVAGTSATVFEGDEDDEVVGVDDLRVCASTDDLRARVFYVDQSSGVMRARFSNLSIVGGAVVASDAVPVYEMSPTSRPFYFRSRYYMTAKTGDSTQGLCVLVDWTDTASTVRPVANIEPGLVSSGDGFNGTVVGKIVALGPERYGFGLRRLKSGQASSASATFGCALVELDFADRDRWQAVEHHGVTVLSGGVTLVYDGSRVTELGFISRPGKLFAFPSGDDGGLTPTIGYRYVAIYEDVNAAGDSVVSGISDPSNVIKPVDEQVTVYMEPLSITSRIGPTLRTVRIALYRTTDGGEPPYYRLNATVVDPSQAIVPYVDTTSDDTLRTNATLYSPSLPGSPGASLDRRAPPGLRHIVSYADMLVGSKGSSLYYSGQPVYGEATWFSPVFEVPLTGVSEITALAVQDGTLYAFAADRIYAISGEIPSDNGVSGGLGSPRLLASDVGCIASRSVVATSFGIFFQSRRGIEILGRGSVSWIGEKVQRTLERFPVVTSAVLDARNSLVRFSLANRLNDEGEVVSYDSEGDYGGGRDIVFDLVLGDWQSVDDKYGSSIHQASQDACVVTFGGHARYAWLAADGSVYVERDSSDELAYRDGRHENWITMSVETGWFKLAGLMGRQMFNRVFLLARKRTPADLSIAIGYNYTLDYAEARTWDNSTLDTLLSSGWPITQLKHNGSLDSDGMAVRIRITDARPEVGEGTPPLGSCRGATWLGLTLDATPKPGAFDVPEDAS